MKIVTGLLAVAILAMVGFIGMQLDASHHGDQAAVVAAEVSTMPVGHHLHHGRRRRRR